MSMLFQQFKKNPLKLIKHSRIQTLLILLFVLQIIVTVGIVGYLSFKNGQEATEELAEDIQREVQTTIDRHLDEYLETPVRIIKTNMDAYELRILDLFNFKTTGQYFWKQLNIFDVSYIGFATIQGEYIGAGDYNRGNFYIEEIPLRQKKRFYTYSTNHRGDRLKIVSIQHLDFLDKAWYKDGIKANNLIWSKIYQWKTDPRIVSIAASYPIRDRFNRLVGLLSVDLQLSYISNLLNKLTIGKTGEAFILERSGLLVASSTEEPPFVRMNGKAHRLDGKNSKDLRIQTTTKYLKQRFHNLDRIKELSQFQIEIDNKPHYVLVSPWKDSFGLDWLVVTVVPKSDFMGKIDENNRTTIRLCLVALLFSVLFGIITSRWIAKPILQLNKAAKEIAGGNLNQTVDLDRHDEVGELARSFNTMAAQLSNSFGKLQSVNDALAASQEQLAQYNQTLEEQVQKRTEELIQSEKMAALGQLTAGIAHEINNPLGAIQAATENVNTAFEQSLQELPQLLLKLNTEQLDGFLIFLATIRQPKEVLSSKEERHLKRKLKQELEALEVKGASTLADILSRMRVNTLSDSLISLLKAKEAISIVGTAHQLFIVADSSQTARLAVERAGKIVFALKNYIRQNSSIAMVKASIAEGIDTVLTIYQNYLKRGVEVIKNYNPVPPILCYPEELTQVWTNLIHNAIQAMNYRGELTIALSQENNHLLVEFTDSGAGVPPEIIDKIFQPFFTTKPIGEGTGLGLDIVRKIIEKHRGRIEVTSVPGRTKFSVWLPVN
jgi:signal transduction histidine kinase